MEAGHVKPAYRKQLKKHIDDMLKTKLYIFELPDDDKFANYVTKMAGFHSEFVKAQGEYRTERMINKNER